MSRKSRGTRDQVANIHWIIEKAREFQKNIYFCFIDHAKAFDCVDYNKLENSYHSACLSCCRHFEFKQATELVPQ